MTNTTTIRAEIAKVNAELEQNATRQQQIRERRLAIPDEIFRAKMAGDAERVQQLQEEDRQRVAEYRTLEDIAAARSDVARVLKSRLFIAEKANLFAKQRSDVSEFVAAVERAAQLAVRLKASNVEYTRDYNRAMGEVGGASRISPDGAAIIAADPCNPTKAAEMPSFARLVFDRLADYTV